MSHKSIPITLVRLFAIGLVIYAFRNAGMAIFFLSGGHTELADLYMLFTGIAVPVIAAGVLWGAPDIVVGQSSANGGKQEKLTFDPRVTFSIGAALIGLYLAVTALASIFEWFLSHSQQKRMMGEMLYTSSASYFELYSDIFLLIIGILLFFGSSGIANIFSIVRNYGIDPADSPNE